MQEETKIVNAPVETHTHTKCTKEMVKKKVENCVAAVSRNPFGGNRREESIIYNYQPATIKQK